MLFVCAHSLVCLLCLVCCHVPLSVCPMFCMLSVGMPAFRDAYACFQCLCPWTSLSVWLCLWLTCTVLCCPFIVWVYLSFLCCLPGCSFCAWALCIVLRFCACHVCMAAMLLCCVSCCGCSFPPPTRADLLCSFLVCRHVDLLLVVAPLFCHVPSWFCRLSDFE